MVDDAAKNGKEAWDAWAALVNRCFDANPAARPAFVELATALSGMLKKQDDQLPAARELAVILRPPAK